MSELREKLAYLERAGKGYYLAYDLTFLAPARHDLNQQVCCTSGRFQNMTEFECATDLPLPGVEASHCADCGEPLDRLPSAWGCVQPKQHVEYAQ